MRRWGLIALVVLATLSAVPTAGAATPRPLWHAFPLGGQPLIQRPSQQPARPPQATHSRVVAPVRGSAQSVEESYSVTFLQVIVATTLLAAVLVLTPMLVIRRRLD